MPRNLVRNDYSGNGLQILYRLLFIVPDMVFARVLSSMGCRENLEKWCMMEWIIFLEIGCQAYMILTFIYLLLLHKHDICVNVPILFQKLHILFLK